MEEKMEISKEIIVEEIQKMKGCYEKLEKLFKEGFPKSNQIKETIKDIKKIDVTGICPDLKMIPKYSWLEEYSDKTLYMFFVIHYPYDHSETKKKFADLKEKGISLPRINKNSKGWNRDQKNESICLYVGSSKNIQKRLTEHLFSYYPKTYALHLIDWYDENELVSITLWDFSKFLKDQSHSTEYLQIIEDLLWKKYQPLLGRQGKK